MKSLLIYNPYAGDRTFTDYLDYIIDRLQRNNNLINVFRVSRNGDEERALSSIRKNEYDKILVAGGDNTLSRVVRAMIKYDINIPIGIFPTGTYNDYASSLILTDNIDESIDIILGSKYTFSDIGKVNDKYFINYISLGNLGQIDRPESVADTMGALAYYLKSEEEFKKVTPINIKVDCEEFKYDGDIYFAIILNGSFIDGFNSKMNSSLNDGLLNVLILKKFPEKELVKTMKDLINNNFSNNEYIEYFITDKIVIYGTDDVCIDIDGEYVSQLPLNIRVSNKKLKVITNKQIHDKVSRQDKTKTFSDVKSAFKIISERVVEGVKFPIKKLSPVKDVIKVLADLPRHNTFSYINKHSLSNDFFKKAKRTLDNGYVFLILSSTGSPASNLIGRFTGRQYAHISLAFDAKLKTLVSYNGGNGIYAPGLNQEMLEFLNQKEDSSIIVYKIKVTKNEKKIIYDELVKINDKGSSYNILGMLLPYTVRENIMFCSQFVYRMLKVAGIEYFEKRPEEVRPTDFVEKDYKRKLEFCYEILVKDILKSNDI